MLLSKVNIASLNLRKYYADKCFLFFSRLKNYVKSLERLLCLFSASASRESSDLVIHFGTSESAKMPAIFDSLYGPRQPCVRVTSSLPLVGWLRNTTSNGSSRLYACFVSPYRFAQRVNSPTWSLSGTSRLRCALPGGQRVKLLAIFILVRVLV